MFSVESKEAKAARLKSEILLSDPRNEGDDNEEKKIFERAKCSYQNLSERFLFKVGQKNFSRQYSHIYSVRLMAMRKMLAAAARRKWGGSLPIRKLVNLKTDEKCCIIGTLFKKMELKPSILKEISTEHNLIPQPPRSKYIDDDDDLVLEDEKERVVLTGNITAGESVTGTVVAICGKTGDSGKFKVEEYCFSGLPYQTAPELDASLAKGDDRYIAIVSGLGYGSKEQDLMSLQLFADLMTGELGTPQEQEMYSKVVRVILAGNSLSQCTQSKESETKAKYLMKKTVAGSVEAIKSLDDLLLQLGMSIPVDVMPGQFDPANHTLPQQPLHHCMFPQAGAYPTVQGVTNPYEALVGGLRIVGTAGQNINDVYRVSSQEDRMEIMENTLLWSHLAPTAPDTLGCYPYYDKDPFILDKCPHMYFVANQPKFQAKVIEGNSGQRVLLVMVPEFSESKTSILVNLRTLDCRQVCFDASSLTGKQSGQQEQEEEQMDM